ncbi:hypothetical protein ACYULU_04230 [Breznakiellaceae bacterium SP9]
MLPYKMSITGNWKRFSSGAYNYAFNLQTGFFARIGHTYQDDPEWSPFGPELFDCEVVNKCLGLGKEGKLCEYCYKSNTHEGTVLSFGDFKTIIQNVNFSNQLTQVAFGTGSHGIEDPGIFDKSEWLRSQNIIPNGTIADINDATAKHIAKLWGAAACSAHLYNGKELCYDTIERLCSFVGKQGNTLQQVTMHLLVYEENFSDVLGILWDIRHVKQLSGLTAVVFLSLKNKGRAAGLHFTPLSQAHYTMLIQYCLDPHHHISFGSDSCGCHKVIEALKGHPYEASLAAMTEPCESGLFSFYANCKGIGFPCSFMEDIEGVPTINLLQDDFKAYWTKDAANWREKLLAGKRICPKYRV